MLRYRSDDRLRRLLKESGILQYLNTGIRRRSPHEGMTDFPAGPAHGCMCSDNFRAAVCDPAVRVHNAAGELYQLSDMTDDEDILKACRSRLIQRVADEVRACHDRHVQSVYPILCGPAGYVSKTVVSGSQNKSPLSHCGFLPDLHSDGGFQSRKTHGLHDSTRAEDGDTSLNAKSRVKSLLRNITPFRRIDSNFDRTVISEGISCVRDRLADHLPWDRIDRGSPDRLVKTRQSDAANAGAAGDGYKFGCICTFVRDALGRICTFDRNVTGWTFTFFSIRYRCSGINQDAVGCVFVIARVLANGAGCGSVAD